MKRLFVYGFPGLYGGAGTELHHQIIAWQQMGMAVHLIPTNAGYRNEPLYKLMLDTGVTVHSAHDWSDIEAEDPVFGFCSADFLNRLPEIRERTKRTVFAGKRGQEKIHDKRSLEKRGQEKIHDKRSLE